MSRRLEIEYPKLPPSDNHIREVKTFTAKGRTWGGKRKLMNTIGYTTEAENYKKEFVSWIDENHFDAIQDFVLGHKKSSAYDLEIRLYFPKWDLLTKGWLEKTKAGKRKAKSPYKRVDTLNRRKLLEDGLSEALSIDDSLTWEANVVKLIASDESEARVVMILTERDPRCFGVPEEFLDE